VRVKLDGKFAYLTESTRDELIWLEKRLYWETKDGDHTSLLFYQYPEYHQNPYTFAGLIEVLQSVSPFQIIIENPIKIEHDLVQIPKDYLQGIELDDYQVSAAQKAISWKKGINIIPTGGGKTEVMLVVLKHLLETGKVTRGVIIVPSVGLADQFFDRAMKRGYSRDQIAVLHGGSKPRGTEALIVGVVNSISNVIKNPGHYLYDHIINCDLLMEDEGHHGKATSWMNIALSTNPKYFLIYSGSAFKEATIWEDPGDCLLYGLAGRICFNLPASYLVDIGRIARPVVYYKTVPGRMLKWPQNWNTIYNNYVIEHKTRNLFITQYASKFAKMGFKVLILVQRLDHAKTLMASLKDHKVICVFGGETSLQYDEFGVINEVPINYDFFRNAFEAGAWDITIGSQVLDEGFDIPSIGAVIAGGGGKSRIKGLQRLGRGLRKKTKGRNHVYFVDFYDKSHVFLASHSKKRIQLLADMDPIIPENELEFWKTVAEHSKELQDESDVQNKK